MIFVSRAIVLLSAAAVVSAANRHGGPLPPRAHQLDATYTFDEYLSHFDKSYDDPDEYDRRSSKFAENLDMILSHNEGRMTENGDVLKGYVMGVNKFTDAYGAEELPLGYNKALHPAWSPAGGAVLRTERLLGAGGMNTEAYSKSPEFDMDEVDTLPISVDWAEKGKVNQAPSQGGCGSCWTFAATAIIESHLSIATGEDPPDLSEQTMLLCTPNPQQCGGSGGCEGSTVELALNYVADVTTQKTGGMYDIGDVPYSTATGMSCEGVAEGESPKVGIEGWVKLPTNSYAAVMNGLAKVGPLAIAAAAGGWMFYEKGVFDNTDHTDINHAIVLAGYGVDEATGEKFYKIRNSWGRSFGEDGYIRIKRTDDDDNSCQMDTVPLQGIACALDESGNAVTPPAAKICAVNGVLFDVAYPVGVHRIV